MITSHRQLGLAPFDPKEMLECMKELIRIERKWIPEKPFHSLYVRPTSIAMDNHLTVGKVDKFKTFTVLSPVGPYFPKGLVPINLYCDDKHVRAWPKGFGDKKVGGNYAPTMRTARLAMQEHGAD
mmetsp:Transcript_26211/g.25378  ORF Transcript_26211/g.25378 Transcript_26211/m.25378 type:complete len:125 (+) Transcript_26211:398-772(+)